MMDDSLKWSGKLILMMKGNILQQKINILNKKEEEIHKCVSTLKLSPENKKFIIRTIGSSIDKFDKLDITKQETEQELFYKIMMMQKLLQQRMDLHKDPGTRSKTEQRLLNCVSKNLNVAINKKFTIKLDILENTEMRKQDLYVNLYGNLTYPHMETHYISPKWLYIINRTYHTDYNPIQCKRKKRESSPERQIKARISYNNVQQKSRLDREVYTVISNEKNTKHELKIDLYQPQKANFINLLQQKQRLWKRQKESRCKNYIKKEKADIKKGSRFHEFCRRNNLKIHFNEFVSDSPIIRFHNKNSIPTHRKIRNINQRFAIKKLLTTRHDNGKHYKLDIEIKDKFQHLALIKQDQYKNLLKELKPWTHLQTNLTSKHYYILPKENGPYPEGKKQYNLNINTHEIVVQGSLISIEYLQFLSIIIEKNSEPEIIQLAVTLQDTTKEFIMVKQHKHIDNLPTQINKKNPNNNRDLYHIKPVFLEVIRRVAEVDRKQMTFSYNEIASYLTKYIHVNKEKFIDKHNFSIAHVRNDLLGLAFNVNHFHINQVDTLIRNQLIPIDNIDIIQCQITIKKNTSYQQTQDYANPKRLRKEEKHQKRDMPDLKVIKKSEHSKYNQKYEKDIAQIDHYYNISFRCKQ